MQGIHNIIFSWPNDKEKNGLTMWDYLYNNCIKTINGNVSRVIQYPVSTFSYQARDC